MGDDVRPLPFGFQLADRSGVRDPLEDHVAGGEGARFDFFVVSARNAVGVLCHGRNGLNALFFEEVKGDLPLLWIGLRCRSVRPRGELSGGHGLVAK